MNKLGDKLFDLCPSWLYRIYDSIKTFPKEVRWKVQRANGKLPACDWWDFDVTLADFIAQGLGNLLYHGSTDWGDKKQKRVFDDLEYAYKFFRDYADGQGEITDIIDGEEYEKFLVRSKEDYEIFNARKEKAFKLLSKHFRELWD